MTNSSPGGVFSTVACAIRNGGIDHGRQESSPASEQVIPYEKLIATIAKLERKGAANPYTSMNGNMFTILHQSRTLAIRLPEDEREQFLKKYKTSLFEAYGPS